MAYTDAQDAYISTHIRRNIKNQKKRSATDLLNDKKERIYYNERKSYFSIFRRT